MRVIINGDVHIHEETQNKSSSIKGIRLSSALSNTKKKVKGRDGICQCCGDDGGGHLEVHHILPISSYKDLACDMGNMISLCQRCHKKYHDTYSEVNAITFTEFIKLYGGK